MRQDDLLELIHGEIDGVNSEADSVLLRRHLEQNPRDDHLYCEIRQVVSALNSAAEIEPTAGLRDKILGSIEWRKPNRFAEMLKALRPEAPALKLGFAFALGSFVAIVGMQLSPQLSLHDTGNMNNMVGTMVRHGPEANPETPEEIRIDADRVAGSVVAHQIDGLQVVEVELVAADAFELVAEYRSIDFKLEAIVRRGEGFPSISRTGNTVVVSNDREHRYALLLRNIGSADGHVNFRLYLAGEMIREDTLPLNSTK